MKVVTSTAAYNLKPSLAGFDYPVQQCQTFSDAPGKPLCDQSGPCGGTMTQMLPFSCDPGYAELGVQLGRPHHDASRPSCSATTRCPGSTCPRRRTSIVPADLPANSQAHLGQSAIGQYNVQTTALQNAMVAAGIANGGVLMTPHLMSSIHDSQGALVQTYTPKAAATVATAQAAQQVTSLMEGGDPARRHGGERRLPLLPVRRGQDRYGADRARPPGLTDTWMIGFAPANNPQVAVAVVVPQQSNEPRTAPAWPGRS